MNRLVPAVDELIDGFVDEAGVDFIPLPLLAVAAWQSLGARNSDEARAKALELVCLLYERGHRPGDYDLGTTLDYWPDRGCQAALNRIEREWLAAGQDPNLGEPICWFGLPEK